MPANQIYRYKLSLQDSLYVHTHLVAEAGHFVSTDQPIEVAEELLKFFGNIVGYGPPHSARGLLQRFGVANVEGVPGLAQFYMGESGIWQGDEASILDAANRYFNTGRPPLHA